MKKAALILMVLLLGTVLYAQNSSVPANLAYEIVDGKSVTITRYTGGARTLNIPGQIEGLPVTAIGDLVFPSYTNLTSVTLPSSVTSIGDRAFEGCTNLTGITVDSNNPVYASVDGVLFDKSMRTIILYPRGKQAETYAIPSSVTSIGDSAFNWCWNLKNVTIPSSVTSIGDKAFNVCGGLTSVTIPSSVTSIGNNAFAGCRSLTNLTIPASVISIRDRAFVSCDSLTDITVDSSNPAYASVDGVLFDKAIQTIIAYPVGKQAVTYVIPSSVRSIGNSAFWRCSNLTSISIPTSVRSIGDHAFYGCKSMTSVAIGSSVTVIGDNAFESCSSLTNITIPSSVTSIGNSAFSQCVSLASVTIPSSV
ncbi:MAG: leucine-rich repeat domain-containing protein, partial [Treponema sp.]|nr:leucine-rich repeat domain-containing protein [Treponema sp.]